MIVDDDEADGEDAMEVCDSETENGAQPVCIFHFVRSISH
jgi:hypothetical protein